MAVTARNGPEAEQGPVRQPITEVVAAHGRLQRRQDFLHMPVVGQPWLSASLVRTAFMAAAWRSAGPLVCAAC